jgi:hypothetical protein
MIVNPHESLPYFFHLQILCILLLLAEYCHGFYVPGVAPVEFKKGQKIDVKAVKMTRSVKF